MFKLQNAARTPLDKSEALSYTLIVSVSVYHDTSCGHWFAEYRHGLNTAVTIFHISKWSI